MKKVLISLLVVLVILTTVFAFACNTEKKPEGEYTIVSPDGAPAFALASFFEQPNSDATFKVIPSIVSSTLIKAEAIKADFAIVPANMAAILYNQGAEYKMVASVTNGNMFFVSNHENTTFTLNDLKGHVLYSIGQGSVPAFIMLNILTNAGIECEVSETPVEGKVAIQYVADGPALITKVKTATGTVYGNLAEPAVTTFMSKGGYRVADVQELWKESTGSSIKGFAQAVLIAKKSICDEKPEVVEAVINSIKGSETFIIEHAEEVRQKIKLRYEETSLKNPITSEVVQNCNVHIYKASENIDYILATLNAAYAINSQSVGGSVPAKDSGFYY